MKQTFWLRHVGDELPVRNVAYARGTGTAYAVPFAHLSSILRKLTLAWAGARGGRGVRPIVHHIPQQRPRSGLGTAWVGEFFRCQRLLS